MLTCDNRLDIKRYCFLISYSRRFRPDVTKLKPAVVVILAGINDTAGDTGRLKKYLQHCFHGRTRKGK